MYSTARLMHPEQTSCLLRKKRLPKDEVNVLIVIVFILHRAKKAASLQKLVSIFKELKIIYKLVNIYNKKKSVAIKSKILILKQNERKMFQIKFSFFND
jgi:hypothetical protein